jgi:hypothetical protein
MEMRFLLLQQRPGEPYVPVALPKWGRWVRSQTGVPRFSFERRIEQLAAPASYRALITFRWRSAAGRVLRTAQRRSMPCAQPDPRPDLVASDLTTSATGTPGTSRYDVVVRNVGRDAAALPFEVTLAEDDREVGRAKVATLAAGASTTVTFSAPTCTPGRVLHVDVDARGAVDEASERNNTFARPCPVQG